MKRNIISEDLRWRVIYLYYDGFPLQEISELLRISAPTVTRIMKCFEQWRCVINPLKGQVGRRKIFNGSDMRVNFYNITSFYIKYILCIYLYFIDFMRSNKRAS
jgi:Homeodomain-like domain